MKHLFYLIALLLLAGCQQKEKYQTIKEKEFSELSRKENVIVLDIRTPEEYNEGHLEHAKLLNYNNENFLTEIDKLDKTKTYLVYCKAGGRSAKASEEMSKKGFTLYNLEGGISRWSGKIVQ